VGQSLADMGNLRPGFCELVFNAFYGNPSAAAKTLQLTLNQRGYSLAPDGIMGSKTLAAVNVETAKDKTGLYNAYRAAWLSYLQSLGNATYTAGWTNRMDTFFPPLPGQRNTRHAICPTQLPGRTLAAAVFRNVQKQPTMRYGCGRPWPCFLA
jgi:lysozyme family protein